MKTIPIASVALATLLALSVPQSSRAFSWAASGLDGAGTQNCIAIQPNGSGTILSASDVSGIQRSTDYGKSWQGVNQGMAPGAPGKAATVVWSNNSSNVNTAYAGDLDGVFISTNAGKTWAPTITASNPPVNPTFLGNGTSSVRWPRSTGNLIACDQSASFPGYLYAGGVDSVSGANAVMRSSDNGATWTIIFTSPDYIRGVALDPTTPTTLYVATYGAGVFKTTAARTVGTGGWGSALSGGPAKPEEMLVLTDHTLYVAGADSTGGNGNIWKSSGSTLAATGAPTASGTTYLGISGYGTGTTATIYACASSPASSGTADASVIKSINGGGTWTNITQTSNVSNQIGGAGGPPWWQLLSGNAPYYELGAGSGDMATIEVDPSNPATVFTGGRGGIWATFNATATPMSTIQWYPYVAGLSVCGADWVAADPAHPGRVYVTDEDWTFFYSTDGGKSFLRNANGMSAGTTGRPIFVDPVNSTVYCGQLQDDSTLIGDIYSNPDPTTGGAWTSTGFNSGLSVGAKPRGVAAGRNSSGQVVLVAVADKTSGAAGPGLWQSVNGGAWAQKSTSITPSGAQVVPIAWIANSAYVFVYAQNSGLWRSSDWGATYTPIWAHTSSGVGTGFLVEDPNQEGRLYLSTSAGVYRFDDARTGTTFSPQLMGGPAHPGALTLANGILYCCNQYTGSGADGAMYRWLSPSNNVGNAPISGDPYAGQSEWPSGLAVDSNGKIYISERDEGCMVGDPTLFADDFGSGTSNWTPDGGTWTTTTLGGSTVYQGSNSTSSAISYVNYSGSSSWQSYSVSAGVTPVSFTAGSAGISLNFLDANDRYILQITPAGAVNLKSDSGGTQTTLGSPGHYTYTSGATYTLQLVANNLAGTLTGYINGVMAVQATGVTFVPASGTAALNVYQGTTDFDNVLIDQL